MGTSSGATRKLSVLVVDDEELIANSLVQILNMFGFDASPLYSGFHAVILITGVIFGVLSGWAANAWGASLSN